MKGLHKINQQLAGKQAEGTTQESHYGMKASKKPNKAKAKKSAKAGYAKRGR
jgi:hypothetical protein